MKQKLAAAAFRLDMSGFASNIWRVDLPEHQTFDDCLDPTFWMHVVTKVAGEDKAAFRGVGDKIVAFKRDTMSLREYMISGIGEGFIKLVEAAKYDSPAAPELPASSPLQTRWNVGKRGHEVVRTEAEGIVTVMAGPYQTKDQAVAWITDHLKKMAA